VAIAQAADGSVRDALSLAERVLAYSREHLKAVDVMSALGLVGYALNRSLSEAVFAADAAVAVQRFRDAIAQGYGARGLLLELSRLWHQLACLQADASLLDAEIDAEHRTWLEQQFERLTAQGLDLRYQVLLQGIRDLALVDERMGAEMVLMRLCGLNAISAVASAAGLPDAETTIAPAFTDIQESKVKMADVVTDKTVTGEARAVVNSSGKAAEKIVEKTVAKVIDKVANDLPLHEKTAIGGNRFTTWQEVVDAFAAIKPGVSAMLDHVICIEFGDKVRLGLDKHQQRAIAAADRTAFVDWLGREVLWESRQQDQGESLSQERSKQARAEEVRLRKGAENDPHVQALMQEMDAKLIKVLPAGVSGNDE